MTNLFRAFRPLLSDFLSTIFFVALYAFTHDLYLSVGIAIAVGIAQIALARLRGRKIEIMQWASLALVVVLGTATLLTADPRFVMVKPSIAGAAIGSVMLKRGWMDRYLPEIVRSNIAPGIITAFGYIWSFTIFALAAANLFIALKLGFAAWTWFASFVPLTVQLGLFLVQYFTFRHFIVRAIRARSAAAGGAQAAAE